MNRFAIAFYIFYVIIILAFIAFVILFWNKRLPFRSSTGITHLFVSCCCVFQAIVFCVFYEIDSPPTLDLFLRHIYRISTKWHGAFRNEALKNHGSDPKFKNDYGKFIRNKPFELSVVQNLCINFGIIALILTILWVISLGLYFVFLRLKTPKKTGNDPKNPKPKITDEIGKMISPDASSRTFMQRLALSFAFLLATAMSLAFTVEIMFYIFFEFHKATPTSHLFQFSLAFALFAFLIHLALILWVLAYPFLFLRQFKGVKPLAPKKTNPQYDIELKNYNLDLKAYNTKYSDLTMLDPDPSKKKHAPYCWLFIIQGLKFKLICPYFLGITSICYFFYSLFVAVAYKPGHSGVIVNFLIVTFLFLQTLLFPLVNFLENIFLIAGYFFFWLGYFMLMILSVAVKGGKARCRLGNAINAFFFIGWFILMLGVLYCMFMLWNFLRGKKSGYTSQNIGRVSNETDRNNLRRNMNNNVEYRVSGERRDQNGVNVKGKGNRKGNRKGNMNQNGKMYTSDNKQINTVIENDTNRFSNNNERRVNKNYKDSKPYSPGRNSTNKNTIKINNNIENRGTPYLTPDIGSGEYMDDVPETNNKGTTVFDTFSNQNKEDLRSNLKNNLDLNRNENIINRNNITNETITNNFKKDTQNVYRGQNNQGNYNTNNDPVKYDREPGLAMIPDENESAIEYDENESDAYVNRSKFKNYENFLREQQHKRESQNQINNYRRNETNYQPPMSNNRNDFRKIPNRLPEEDNQRNYEMGRNQPQSYTNNLNGSGVINSNPRVIRREYVKSNDYPNQTNDRIVVNRKVDSTGRNPNNQNYYSTKIRTSDVRPKYNLSNNANSQIKNSKHSDSNMRYY